MKRLFILGAPRSGTTWLQILCAQHPAVVTTSETHIYTQYLNLLEARWEHEKERSRGSHKVSGLTQIIDEPTFYHATRQFAETVYMEVAKKKPGASVLLDKTPENLLHTDHILRHFPDAYFVHIVRDPRAVAASFKLASRGWWDWTQSGPIGIAKRWKTDVLAGRSISEKSDKYFELTYEDLLSDGAQVISQVFGFIDQPLTIEECARIYEQCSISNLQSSGNATLVQPWNIAGEPKGFFRQGNAESWRRDLSSYEIYATEVETQTLDQEAEGPNIRFLNRARHLAQTGLLKAAVGAVKILRGLEWRLSAFIKKL